MPKHLQISDKHISGSTDNCFRAWFSAMGGSVLFQDALKARLDLMQPSHQDVQRFLASHPPRISQGNHSDLPISIHLAFILLIHCQ